MTVADWRFLHSLVSVQGRRGTTDQSSKRGFVFAIVARVGFVRIKLFELCIDVGMSLQWSVG